MSPDELAVHLEMKSRETVNKEMQEVKERKKKRSLITIAKLVKAWRLRKIIRKRIHTKMARKIWSWYRTRKLFYFLRKFIFESRKHFVALINIKRFIKKRKVVIFIRKKRAIAIQRWFRKCYQRKLRKQVASATRNGIINKYLYRFHEKYSELSRKVSLLDELVKLVTPDSIYDKIILLHKLSDDNFKRETYHLAEYFRDRPTPLLARQYLYEIISLHSHIKKIESDVFSLDQKVMFLETSSIMNAINIANRNFSLDKTDGLSGNKVLEKIQSYERKSSNNSVNEKTDGSVDYLDSEYSEYKSGINSNIAKVVSEVNPIHPSSTSEIAEKGEASGELFL